jgi:hypothetical protein
MPISIPSSPGTFRRTGTGKAALPKRVSIPSSSGNAFRLLCQKNYAVDRCPAKGVGKNRWTPNPTYTKYPGQPEIPPCWGRIAIHFVCLSIHALRLAWVGWQWGTGTHQYNHPRHFIELTTTPEGKIPLPSVSKYTLSGIGYARTSPRLF